MSGGILSSKRILLTPNEARVARLGPLLPAQSAAAVIQRRNNRQTIFFCEDKHGRLHGSPAEAAAAHDCAVHAYVLMTHHLHLLLTPGDQKNLPPHDAAIRPPCRSFAEGTASQTGRRSRGKSTLTPIPRLIDSLQCNQWLSTLCGLGKFAGVDKLRDEVGAGERSEQE